MSQSSCGMYRSPHRKTSNKVSVTGKLVRFHSPSIPLVLFDYWVPRKGSSMKPPGGHSGNRKAGRR
jgi:hypothetical protein